MSTLARTAAGDVAIPLKIQTDPKTLAAQKLQDQFGLWLGEWFVDTTQGFPWIPRVLGLKNPNLSQIRSLLRQAILECPGMQSVIDLQLSFNARTRALTYSFSARLSSGFIVTGGTGIPFVVTGSV